MIISEDSPFRRLPADLNAEQAAFLDGVRYAADMVGLSYERLKLALRKLATEEKPGQVYFTAAFQDAWSIVDSVHRLRRILGHMPGMTNSTPRYKLFARRTAVAEELRNRIQHLGERLKAVASDGEPVWGTLAWTTVVETDPLKV